jgi:hypothetical protein
MVTELIQTKNLTRVAKSCQSQQLADAGHSPRFQLAPKDSDWKTGIICAAPKIPKRQ